MLPNSRLCKTQEVTSYCLKEIGIKIPDCNYNELVVSPRNSVRHNKDIYPSDKTTDNLFACVEAFLKAFHDSYY